MNRHTAFLMLALTAAGTFVRTAHAEGAHATRTTWQGSGEVAGTQWVAGETGAEIASLGVELGPGTVVRERVGSVRLMLGGGRLTRTPVITLVSGRVTVRIPEGGSPVFVRSPKADGAIVQSGEAQIVRTGSVTHVANVDGTVRAGRGSKWRPLAAGRKVAVSAGSSAESDLPAPPRISQWDGLSVALDGTATFDDLRWTPVPRASGYEVRLRRGNETIDRVDADGTRMTRAFRGVSAGSYEVSARTIDEDGIRGPWSEPRGLRAVGVQLPDGAFVEADGTVRLEPADRVRFDNADGLFVMYRGAETWSSHARTARLYQGDRTAVLLRDAQSGSQALVQLAPRNITARVWVGPKDAVWPDDPIRIRIRLERSDGGRLPEWIEPRVRVHLGIDPIDVEFTRNGNVLHATVPPQPGLGPCVLRTDVTDQFGIALGRDFVEIVRDTSGALRIAGAAGHGHGHERDAAVRPDAPGLVAERK